MSYSNFFNTKIKFSKAKSWQTPDYVNDILHEIESYSFSQQRDDIRYELNLISTTSYQSDYCRAFCNLVDQDKRFSEREFMYNMSHPTYLNIFSNLYSALDFEDTKRRQQQPKTNGYSCNHNSYDYALKLYASSLLELKSAIISGVGVYDRESFEKEHDLQWMPY